MLMCSSVVKVLVKVLLKVPVWVLLDWKRVNKQQMQKLLWKICCCQNHRAADARQSFQEQNLQSLPPGGSDGTREEEPCPAPANLC